MFIIVNFYKIWIPFPRRSCVTAVEKMGKMIWGKWDEGKWDEAKHVNDDYLENIFRVTEPNSFYFLCISSAWKKTSDIKKRDDREIGLQAKRWRSIRGEEECGRGEKRGKTLKTSHASGGGRTIWCGDPGYDMGEDRQTLKMSHKK